MVDPVPLPNNPLRYVLVYLLELKSGAAVIDTGWSTEEAWSALVAGMAVAGYTPADVQAILITHIHPDHYGLAGRLREASGGWVALHPADAALIPARYGLGVDRLLENMDALLVDAGVPDQIREELTGASMGIREFVAAAEPDVLLEDRAPVPLPRVGSRHAAHPGHSPGHVCFHDRAGRVLFSGDHVLPRISPSVAVHVQQPVNPLADFLDALRGVRDLDIDEVLPAHEWRFRGLDARVDQLLDHHRVRLDETYAAVSAAPELHLLGDDASAPLVTGLVADRRLHAPRGRGRDARAPRAPRELRARTTRRGAPCRLVSGDRHLSSLIGSGRWTPTRSR